MKTASEDRKSLKPVVMVIDDDRSVREAIDSLLRSVGLNVACFASTDEFLATELPDAPTCLVLDVRMPGMSGLDFQRDLIAQSAALPIIFITAHGDVPMSVKAMKAGAVEFLTKPFRDQDLLDAIQVGLERSRIQRREASALATLRQRFALLTQRERDVMERVVEGSPNKDIAAELNLSEITVKTHRGQVMRKMQASSLPDLVRMSEKLARR